MQLQLFHFSNFITSDMLTLVNCRQLRLSSGLHWHIIYTVVWTW